MADYHIDVLVIGAGVIGLAIARELALSGREVIVTESESGIGTGISSRNSEVIHAGIYYPTGSLKAVTCVKGKKLLYDYCVSRNIPHQKCGKLIVATHDNQISQLQALKKRAFANNVIDLKMLSAAELCRLEPEITGSAALFSPSTGIIDSHQFMVSLQADLEAAGGLVILHSPVLKGVINYDGGAELTIGGEQNSQVSANTIVNAAGLQAIPLLTRIQHYPAERIPQLRLAKGDYFALAGKTDFRHLIYPLPEPDGLGVHLTLDLAGQARFGPDVEWVDNLTFDVAVSKENLFRRAISQYWPGIYQRTLVPAYAGIRPKLKPEAKGKGITDFVIETPEHHGVSGWYNLFGIESPGLTASLALAEHLAGFVSDQ